MKNLNIVRGHFINVRVIPGKGGASVLYQYPRRPIPGQDPYEARTSWGPDRMQARVFTNKAAARGSAGSFKGDKNCHIVRVKLVDIDQPVY